MNNISEYIIKSGVDFKDKIAFGDEKRQISFGQVLDESSRIASLLVKQNFSKKPIAVYIDKSASCICAMMGVVLSGNFYTVLDTSMPVERINKIMEVLQPSMIITDEKNKEAAKELGCSLIIFEEAVSRQITEEERKAVLDAAAAIDKDDILYVLFTSGSTGTPKGVTITHGGVDPYLKWLSEDFHIDENTVFANQTPFYFVMSGLDIYMTIYAGATCYIVPKRYFSFPVMVLDFLKEHHVNTLYWVPSILCLIANFRALPEVHLDDLKLIMFSGEVMPAKQLNMWIKEYPNVEFANLYGPTELTDVVAYYRVNGQVDESASLPIGKAVSHMEILILDENGKPVKDGDVGELCGTGPSVAKGYYNMPEKTAEVFVKNPLDPTGESMMYRTGDLAKVDENGDIIYMGRKDFQIKHMGNRIELGEIETAVSAIDGILLNCCLYDTKRSKIVLFYTGNIGEDSIDEQLKKKLPVYMIPNRIEKLDSMPLNLNGKIDRAKLKENI